MSSLREFRVALDAANGKKYRPTWFLLDRSLLVMRNGWSNHVLDSMARRSQVTVGVGVFCDAGFSEQCIVMAVDDQGTYGNPPVTKDHACGKFVDMLPVVPVVVAISGSVSTCDAVVWEFYEQLKTFKLSQENKGESLQLDHLSVGIRNARQYEYEKFLRQEMHGYLGMTLEQWQEATNPEKRRKGYAVARAARLYFPVWLIAGGFWGPGFGLVASSGACVTEMGARHFAVGVGSLAALRRLHSRSQDPYTSAPRTLLHVAEAMDAAKSEHPEFIGRPVDYVILRPNKPIMRFPAESGVLERWKTAFRGAPTDELQDSTEFRKEFEAELYEHQSANPILG